MLLPQFRDEDIALLRQVTERVSPAPGLPKETVTHLVPDTTYRGYVQPLGVEEAVRMGLKADVARWRVRLPGGMQVKPGDVLRFRGKDWKAMLVTPYSSYTRVIAEGV